MAYTHTGGMLGSNWIETETPSRATPEHGVSLYQLEKDGPLCVTQSEKASPCVRWAVETAFGFKVSRPSSLLCATRGSGESCPISQRSLLNGQIRL